MTVKELFKLLQHYPQDHEIYYECAEWGLQPVKDVYIREHDATDDSIVFLSNLSA